MVTRVLAGSILLTTAGVAWLTINVTFAARLLQILVAVSVLYVAWLAWRGARIMRRALVDSRAGAHEPTGLAEPFPFVSLVLPARNEATVIGETVMAFRRISYAGRDGAPRFELLVVDDGSVDATGDVARDAAEGCAHITVRRREETKGPGTKGAVLGFAQPYLRADVIGAVDADTRVAPEFLECAMRAWRRDPAAAALQVSRRPRNESTSWLTRAQAEEQLMDMASQCGRWDTDGTAELRGNGMFIRRDVLEAVGGWDPRALTEDLELSTRLSSAGHHVTLAPECVVEEEAVESLEALWHQRRRWAEGSMRRLLQHGPGLLAGSQPIGRKADFGAFAAEFLVPPLFATTIVASLFTIPSPRPADWTVPLSLFIGYGLGVFVLALAGLWASGERGARLVGRAARGTLFLSHWLIVVPVSLFIIAIGPAPGGFVQTQRVTGAQDR